MSETKEGWTWLLNSRKEHYFVEGRSLCGKWMYLGRSDDLEEKAPHNACVMCKKKLEKRKGRKCEH